MPKTTISKFPLALILGFFAFASFPNVTRAETVVVERKAAAFGVIKGVVRDSSGNPIAAATVSIFRVGSSTLLKRVSSSDTGKFFARLVPGTYKIFAMAQGFNPVMLPSVKVNKSAELVYGFNLQRAGGGQTLPERRADKNSSKWRIRAASRRSVFQNQEGGEELIRSVEDQVAAAEEIVDPFSGNEKKASNKSTTVIETFAGIKSGRPITGLNFATVRTFGDKLQLLYSGQIGTGKDAMKRFETALYYRPSEKHELNVRGSIVGIGKLKNEESKYLSQVSFQALDKWRIKEGIIVVFGLDYARFLGAGNDSSLNPRIGFQYDLDSKTRVRSSYTAQTEPMTWQRAMEIEGADVLFRESASIEDIAIKDNKPLMAKNRRFEFGVERILDNRSSIEANAFFDSVIGKGVGFANLPFDSLDSEQFNTHVAAQHGNAEGVRVVYSRRLNSSMSAAIGYAFGNGQKLSENVFENPAEAFSASFFQTLFAEVNGNFSTGTTVKAIYRLSPKATIFAIDPFQGRLAIYDPGLSILVTQELPNLGLPINAEAVIDAKNLFDTNNRFDMQDGLLTINSQRRTLRGGILVRF